MGGVRDVGGDLRNGWDGRGVRGRNGENGASEVIGANKETSAKDAVAAAVGGALFNRLEEVASTIWDGVARYRAALAATRDVLGVQMSGSGTAFFAIYPNETAANEAAETLRRKCVDGETVAVAHTLAQTFRFQTLESTLKQRLSEN